MNTLPRRTGNRFWTAGTGPRFSFTIAWARAHGEFKNGGRQQDVKPKRRRAAAIQGDRFGANLPWRFWHPPGPSSALLSCPASLPFAQRLDIRGRAVAEPAVQLSLVFELQTAHPGNDHETAIDLGQPGHVTPK